MAEQERTQRPKQADHSQDVETGEPTSSAGVEQLKADLDSLLDEIDLVLEDNAEEFVRNYVQKGGE